MNFTQKQVDLIREAAKILKVRGAKLEDRVVTKQDLIDASVKITGGRNAFVFLTKNPALRIGRGEYALPVVSSDSAALPDDMKVKTKTAPAKAADKSVPRKAAPRTGAATAPATVTPIRKDVDMKENKQPQTVTDVAVSVMSTDNLVPKKLSAFVPFGAYDRLLKIIQSGRFVPVYLTGLSGNGKTLMVNQACAEAGREYIRVNITAETDESDLIGGWTLVNGETKFQYGPVIEAMQRGAVLLLDEYDLGGVKTMCLQPVMEGNPIFIKKINRWVHPAPGFTVVATANTKGRGESDRFTGTGVINEAALDRFKATIFHDYPSERVELKILKLWAKEYGIEKDSVIPELLVKWAASNRKSFAENATDEVLTTRRLSAALEFYAIFRDERTAVELVTERFEKDDRDALVKLFMAFVDEDAKKRKAEEEAAKRKEQEEKRKQATAQTVAAAAKSSKKSVKIDPDDPF